MVKMTDQIKHHHTNRAYYTCGTDRQEEEEEEEEDDDDDDLAKNTLKYHLGHSGLYEKIILKWVKCGIKL